MTRQLPRRITRLETHLAALQACRRCSGMQPGVVVGRPVRSKILLVGQAPGDKEPVLGRPFAWTAGKTLFRWFEQALGWTEDETRSRIYFAAVCRCFPGKRPTGGDRVPAPDEIKACRHWLEREFALLKPELVLPVGKLAMAQFFAPAGGAAAAPGLPPLTDLVGKKFRLRIFGRETDVIPLPHPSGASPWHRMEPGKTLLAHALRLIARHPAIASARLLESPA
jgi:uracil-DNA glycosylase